MAVWRVDLHVLSLIVARHRPRTVVVGSWYGSLMIWHEAVLPGSGTGAVVAEHVLAAPGEASVRDEHYGGPRPAPRRAVRPKTVAEKEFCALGPVAEAFITGAAAAGHTRLGPELAELNTLRAAHGDDAFLAALDRAVAFSRWRAADVRSILAAGPGTADPARPGTP